MKRRLSGARLSGDKALDEDETSTQECGVQPP